MTRITSEWEYFRSKKKPPTLEMTQQSTTSHINKKRWGNRRFNLFCDAEFYPSKCQTAANIKQPRQPFRLQQNATNTAKFLNNQPRVIATIRNMWHVMIFQGTVHRSNSGGGFASLIVASFIREGCCCWGGHDTGLNFKLIHGFDCRRVVLRCSYVLFGEWQCTRGELSFCVTWP
jgi:hypothetical protein